ncbi:MAG: hypothetical protein MZV64_65060 [Ignavibacteriales bacterium]|nr:hypothetical protein [Ignavibacteriales bacterium]
MESASLQIRFFPNHEGRLTLNLETPGISNEKSMSKDESILLFKISGTIFLNNSVQHLHRLAALVLFSSLCRAFLTIGGALTLK